MAWLRADGHSMNTWIDVDMFYSIIRRHYFSVKGATDDLGDFNNTLEHFDIHVSEHISTALFGLIRTVKPLLLDAH